MSASISAADQAALQAATASANDAIAEATQTDATGNYVITSLQQITDIFDSLSGAAVMADAPGAFAYSGPLNTGGIDSQFITRAC